MPRGDTRRHAQDLQLTEPALTSLAHGGGCGCKIAPGLLADLLRSDSGLGAYANLLVGRETSDDAAVYRLDDERALIATTDFFTPIVDDPFLFGRIAATNALSDVYAMGGRPILALAVLGMPISVLSPATIREILRGGESVCASIGVPVAGGHSIDTAEPIYGLVAIGLVNTGEVLTNRGAKPGDQLILTKPLGVGVLSAAYRQGRLGAAGLADLERVTTQLNVVGTELAGRPGVNGLTDVTGFGLVGHALELARGSNARIRLDPKAAPMLARAVALAGEGVRTGASERNWASFGADVQGADRLDDVARILLADPQTSGGLLISVADEAMTKTLDLVRSRGFADAAVVGRVEDGPPGLTFAA
jgi:selenide,water dikinase